MTNLVSQYVGLFGHAKVVNISNLTIRDSVIITTYNGACAGVFVGDGYRVDLTNCASVNNIVIAWDSGVLTNVGGIAGKFSYATISQCYTEGGRVSGGGYAGGLCGRAESSGSIQNCWNSAEVAGSVDAGGISAHIGSINVRNSCNLGAVSGSARVGGIGATITNSSILNCYTTNNVTKGSTSFSGTFAGYLSKTEVKGCYVQEGSSLPDIKGGESAQLPHFTGKGTLSEGGSEDELCKALNEYLYQMQGLTGLRKWMQSTGSYPLPNGEVFVDNTSYYGVWLNRVRVSDRNANDILGDSKASHDHATATLTLAKDFTLEGTDQNGLLYTAGTCTGLTVSFNSTSTAGGQPYVIDINNTSSNSGTITFTAEAGKPADVRVTGYGGIGIETGQIILNGPVSLTVTTGGYALHNAKITLNDPDAVLEASGGSFAAFWPVSEIHHQGQKLYEDQGNGLVEVTEFTTTMPDGKNGMYSHILIAPEREGWMKQLLETGAQSDTGTGEYSLDGAKYDTALPKATKAGDYTVYYRVLASTNYKAVAAQTIKVRIERQEVEIPAEEGRSIPIPWGASAARMRPFACAEKKNSRGARFQDGEGRTGRQSGGAGAGHAADCCLWERGNRAQLRRWNDCSKLSVGRPEIRTGIRHSPTLRPEQKRLPKVFSTPGGAALEQLVERLLQMLDHGLLPLGGVVMIKGIEKAGVRLDRGGHTLLNGERLYPHIKHALADGLLNGDHELVVGRFCDFNVKQLVIFGK